MNPHFQGHYRRAHHWQRGFERRHPHLVHNIGVWRNHWREQHWSGVNYRWGVYRHFGHDYYRYYYSSWYRWGFYGGFWYPTRPCLVIEQYFTYPMVYWFYVEKPDPAYFAGWYEPIAPEPQPGVEPVPPPEPMTCEVTQFPYAGGYFPTDTLRDLLVEASGFPAPLRCAFMTAITVMTDQLRDQVGAQLQQNPFAFLPNDIVLNYYENLQNQAIRVAGYVDHGGLHIAFQGLMDLVDPTRSSVLVPQGQEPKAEELNKLETMNARIKELGGNPHSTTEEPPTAPENPPPPGSNE